MYSSDFIVLLCPPISNFVWQGEDSICEVRAFVDVFKLLFCGWSRVSWIVLIYSWPDKTHSGNMYVVMYVLRQSHVIHCVAANVQMPACLRFTTLFGVSGKLCCLETEIIVLFRCLEFRIWAGRGEFSSAFPRYRVLYLPSSCKVH